MNSLARNIIRTFSTQVGCQLVSVLAGIVIARTLGPIGKGYLSYALTAISFASVFFYGFADAVLYQFGKQKHPARTVYAAVMRVLAASLFIIVPIFVVVGLLVQSQRPLIAAAIALPFAIYLQLTTPFLMVRNNMTLVNTRQIVQYIGSAAVTVPLLLFTPVGLAGAVAVWILFYVIVAVMTGPGLRQILAESPPGLELPRDLLTEQVRFGTRAAGASAAGFLNLRIDVFIVSFLFSATALGWYTLAIASGELLWQVSRAFVWSAIGRIGSDSFADSAALVARLTRNTLAIVGSLGVVAWLIGPWMIEHVYGERFEPAGEALRWALPGLVAYAAEVALTNFIILQLGKPWVLMWVQTLAAVVCAAITFATAGHYGIVAAAAATSFTKLAVTVVLISLFMRGTGISAQRLLLIQRDDLRHYTSVMSGILRTFRLRSA